MAQQNENAPSIRPWLQFGFAAATAMAAAFGWFGRVDTRLSTCEGDIQRVGNEQHVLEQRVSELQTRIHVLIAQYETERRLRQNGMGSNGT